MKEPKTVLLRGIIVLLLAYAILTTVQLRRMENRLGMLETKLTHIFDPKVQLITSNR